MIADKQRREVAEELRGQAEAWRSLMPDISMSDRRLTDSIHMAFGLNDVNITVHEALDMLADLIDRPTCTIANSYQLVTNGLDELELDDMCCFKLSCGHDAYGYEEPKNCPECGAVITDDEH